MTATLPATDPTARARALRDLIEAEARTTEDARTMTPRVVDALRDAGLFWILVPAELGGGEVDVRTALEVFEELAYADGSTGWSLMANATSSCFAGIYLEDEAAQAMFGADGLGIHAGMLGPIGTGVRDGDAYVVDGEYRFGSGCGHSTWFGAGFMETRDGEPLALESGMPAMRVAFVPRDRVELRDGWHVLGLQGTGSFDYAVHGERIDPAFTFPLLEPVQHRGGDVFRIGLFGITAAGHAGFALGVGRRALAEVLDIARRKQRLGGDPIADQQLFQHDFAMHDAAMRAAVSFTYEAFERAETRAREEGAPTPVEAQRMRQATTYATRVAADAARFAYTWAGSDGLREPSVVGRCFRDISAGTQHLYVDNNTLTGYTQTLLMFGAD
jgi:alkylation response protein AidB-like acyl-CoA dehydrogenase